MIQLCIVIGVVVTQLIFIELHTHVNLSKLCGWFQCQRPGFVIIQEVIIGGSRGRVRGTSLYISFQLSVNL